MIADDVEALLDASIHAHRVSLEARLRKDPVKSIEELQRAYDLRVQAHTLDPDHTAPAWETVYIDGAQKGRHLHDSLMGFYKQRLGIA